jgi:hypothetical protein
LYSTTISTPEAGKALNMITLNWKVVPVAVKVLEPGSGSVVMERGVSVGGGGGVGGVGVVPPPPLLFFPHAANMVAINNRK